MEKISMERSPCTVFEGALQDRRDPLDPDPLLLSEEIDDNLIQVMKEEKKICNYLGFADPACQRQHPEADGKKDFQSAAYRSDRQAQEGNPGHMSQDDSDHRVPGRDKGAARGA